MANEKLISASALATVIRDDPYIHGKAYARVRDHIDESPAVDAVEVVRCKDCRFLEIAGCYGECGRAYLGIVKPWDFCSRGERRERENDPRT